MNLVYPILVIVFHASGAQGEWRESGVWSACSRSCGGGITYQERTCLGGNCQGESRAYRSCMLQDCPNGAGDFRKEQCAEFNSLVYRDNKTYDWVPYSGALDNPCSLSCMPKGEWFYETFKEKVVDGTRCTDDTYDMCVDGVCKKAGCDSIIGSPSKEDKCRVCNGNGNSCRTVKDVYKKETKKMGVYIDILEIPAGATNILISEDTSARNYLALRTKDSFIFNGERTFISPKKHKTVGTVVDYKRSGGKEKIFALGPTTEPVYLSVFLWNENVSITYEYSVPRSQKVVNSMITYSWKFAEYSACDKSCNGGTKTRRVFCVQDRDKSEVDDSKCDTTPKPDEEAACNVQPCPPRWFIGAWSPCSRSCEEGTQVRRVHCEKDTPSGVQMVEERLCPGVKVITQQKCVVLAECPKWKLGEWSKCSKSCGGGIRTRSVQCIELNSNLISDDRCSEHTRPRDNERCNETPCAVHWVTGDWGSCRPSCGKGMRTRPVYCASTTQANRRYPDYICNQDIKPEIMIPCNNTAKCPPMWYGSMWSKCTAQCGKGIQMRNVFCGVKQQPDYMKLLPHQRCSLLPEIKKIQQCIIKPCYTQWIVLSWQPCSVTCGEGTRQRVVKCYADSEEDVSAESCDPDTKPHTENICSLKACPDGSNRLTRKQIPQIVATRQPAILPKKAGPSPTELNTPGKPTQQQIITEAPTQGRPTQATRPTRPPVVFRTTQPPRVTATPTREPTKAPIRLSTILFPTAQTKENNGAQGISKPAEIIQGPETTEAVVGSDITLRCVATGNPKPDIFWLKGNVDVSIFGRRFQVLPNGFLRILQVQEVDDDLYTCVANNGISRRSSPGYLGIVTPPYVEISLGYTVKQGEEARIKCTVSGKPRPTVEWYKDGQPLALQRNSRLSITSREIYIKSTELEDHGNYDCRATNKNGVRITGMMLDVMPDEETRLHDLINGACTDSDKLESCAMVGTIDGYCDQPYYQKVCCITCRAKNKLLDRQLEGI